MSWKYIGHCGEGTQFEIEDINVWDHEWLRVNEEVAEIKDPLYGQTHHFHVYEIPANGKVIMFAAGEFSNSVFGFYLPISREK